MRHKHNCPDYLSINSPVFDVYIEQLPGTALAKAVFPDRLLSALDSIC